MADRGPDSGQLLEQNDPAKSAHYLIVFGIGAIGGFIAAVGESLYVGLAAPTILINVSLFELALAVGIAPLVEELTKPLGLLLLKEEEKLRFSLSTWALLGSLAGVGFGFAENVFYFRSVLSYGWGVSLSLLLMRGLLTAPLHGITTTITGFGIGLWQKGGDPQKLVVLLMVAMTIHGSFNLLASLI